MKPEELARRFQTETLDKVKLMSRITLTVEANTKPRVPVDTGTLRRSITHRVERAGERGVVGTNVNYAVYVHEGTWKMRGRPFLEQGLAASRATIDQMLEDAGVELFTRIAR
jgi:HK97 gp10 family phage protein